MTDGRPTDPIVLVRNERLNGNQASLSQLLDVAALSPEQQLNLACVDLIQRIGEGRSTRVEEYIASCPHLADNTGHLLDLIDAEICARREQGDEPVQDEYQNRFPKLQESIGQLFALDTLQMQPDKLGGYQLGEVIGRGAMGIVYKARQLSLDRDVAVKVIKTKWAGNPTVMARFVREAYAAAQLSHHNVVQIYDFGQHDGQYFFSMQWVSGGSLAEFAKRGKPLDPRVAVGFVLQAARGLHYAHRHGMVHRDVKPANLLIDSEGIVKVADLGLVKVPANQEEMLDAAHELLSGREHQTSFGSTVGTPAFMAPEQEIDATSVDLRADIFALGQTLRFLLSGQIPSQDIVDSGVLPHAKLQAIIAKCTAIDPGDRFASAQELIDRLEAYLGIEDSKPVVAPEANVLRIRQLAEAMAKCSRSLLVTWLATGVALTAVVCAAICAVYALAWASFPIAVATGFLIAFVGVFLWRRDDSLTQLAYSFISTIRISSWSKMMIAAALVYAGLWAFGVAGITLVGEIFGAAIGASLGFVFAFTDKDHEDDLRQQAVSLVKQMRLDGWKESQIQTFVYGAAGQYWQPLFESVFGFEAIRSFYGWLASEAKAVVRLPLRYRLMNWLSDRLNERREERDRATLVDVESMGLMAEGMAEQQAREQAWRVAGVLMQASRQVEKNEVDSKIVADAKRARIKAMLEDARSGAYETPAEVKRNVWPEVFGQATRLIVGLALIALVLILARQAGITVSDLQSQAIETSDHEQVGRYLNATGLNAFAFFKLTPVVAIVPLSILLGGVLLVASSFIQGHRVSAYAFPACVIAVFVPALFQGSVRGVVIGSAVALLILGIGAVMSHLHVEVNEN